MLLHCADLGNPARSFDQACEWAKRISTEFTNQVYKERELGMPVTEFLKGLEEEWKIYKQEIGFINFVVKPLWAAMDRLSEGACKFMLENLERNAELYLDESERLQKKKGMPEEEEKKE